MITFPKKIEIVPTKYGSGGRYDPDSETPKVIIRVNKMGEPKFRDVARTQMHEIMHLFLQRFVNEFLVTHGKKECLVDFMVSNFVSTEELGCCSYPRKDGERLYVFGGHLIAEYDVHKGFYDPNVWYPGLLNHLGVEEYIRLVAGLEQGVQ